MGPELARRWIAVLALIPEAEREALVSELERRAADLYAPRTQAPSPDPAPPHRVRARAIKPAPDEVRVIYPPTAGDGYVEELEVTYTPQRDPAPPASPASTPQPRPGAAPSKSRKRA